MPDINRIAIASYAAGSMYALVDDIAAYPDFLPWCDSAAVTRDDTRLDATLNIRYHGIRVAFSTTNIHTPPTHIVMRLKDGPLSKLCGEWQFVPIDKNRCRIEFNLHYEFQNRLFSTAFAGVFAFVFDNFVEHFIKRAEAVYSLAGRGNIAVELVSSANADTPPQTLILEDGATVADALQSAGVTALSAVGIFGRVCTPQTPLTTGDRIEIYEPLKNDPRNARRQRL